MKVNEIIEQCNELLEDETYYLQTIELTKDEVKSLLDEIKRLNNILNNFKKDIEVIEQIEDIEVMKMQLRNIAFRLKGNAK